MAMREEETRKYEDLIRSVENTTESLKKRISDAQLHDRRGDLIPSIRRLAQELLEDTAGLSSGTLTLPHGRRIQDATRAIQDAQDFVYTISIVNEDDWQSATDENPWTLQYQKAISELASNRDVRRLFIFEDRNPKSWPPKLVQFLNGHARTVKVRWIARSEAETAVGKGGLVNMLCRDKTLVTWRHTIPMDHRIEGALSINWYWIEVLKHIFDVLWNNANDWTKNPSISAPKSVSR